MINHALLRSLFIFRSLRDVKEVPLVTRSPDLVTATSLLYRLLAEFPLPRVPRSSCPWRNGLLDPFGYVEKVPLPGLTVIGRKRLTPDRALLVPRVPAEDNDDRLTFESVFAKEMSDTIFK